MTVVTMVVAAMTVVAIATTNNATRIASLAIVDLMVVAAPANASLVGYASETPASLPPLVHPDNM